MPNATTLKPRCVICGCIDCRHLTSYDKLVDLQHYTICTLVDLIHYCKLFNIKKYVITAFVPGTIKIKIYDFWKNTKIFERIIQEQKMVSIVFDIKKISFVEYLNTLGVLRYIRYKYIKFRRGKIVAKNKFDFIMG